MGKTRALERLDLRGHGGRMVEPLMVVPDGLGSIPTGASRSTTRGHRGSDLGPAGVERRVLGEMIVGVAEVASDGEASPDAPEEAPLRGVGEVVDREGRKHDLARPMREFADVARYELAGT